MIFFSVSTTYCCDTCDIPEEKYFSCEKHSENREKAVCKVHVKSRSEIQNSQSSQCQTFKEMTFVKIHYKGCMGAKHFEKWKRNDGK